MRSSASSPTDETSGVPSGGHWSRVTSAQRDMAFVSRRARLGVCGAGSTDACARVVKVERMLRRKLQLLRARAADFELFQMFEFRAGQPDRDKQGTDQKHNAISAATRTRPSSHPSSAAPRRQRRYAAAVPARDFDRTSTKARDIDRIKGVDLPRGSARATAGDPATRVWSAGLGFMHALMDTFEDRATP